MRCLRRVPPIALLAVAMFIDNPVTRTEVLLLAPCIKVFFSPEGGCTDAVVKELDAAKNTVLVQAYSFTPDR